MRDAIRKECEMPEEQDKQQDQNKTGRFASLDDAVKYAESLEKRLQEKDSTIYSLDERIKAIETSQKQKLADDGNWKALAEQRAAEAEALKPIAERAKLLEANIRATNEASIARIPEAKRKYIPTKYSAEDLQAWLTENAAGLVREAAPDFNAGEGGESNPQKMVQLSDDEKRVAASAGISEKDYAFYKSQRGEAVNTDKSSDK